MPAAAWHASSVISTRLIRVCRSSSGALTKTTLLGCATRAAVLADLAFAGALTNTEDGLEVDTAATGFAPADNLLAAIVRQPDKSMEWWLRRGPDSVADVVDELLRTGVWSRRRVGLGHHYEEHDRSAVAHDLDQLRDGVSHSDGDVGDDGHHELDPPSAALAVIVQAAGAGRTGPSRPSNGLVLACAPVGWLIQDLAGYLVDRAALINAAAADARASLSVNFMM